MISDDSLLNDNEILDRFFRLIASLILQILSNFVLQSHDRVQRVLAIGLVDDYGQHLRHTKAGFDGFSVGDDFGEHCDYLLDIAASERISDLGLDLVEDLIVGGVLFCFVVRLVD